MIVQLECIWIIVFLNVHIIIKHVYLDDIIKVMYRYSIKQNLFSAKNQNRIHSQKYV